MVSFVLPQPLSYYRAIEQQERSQHFTNDNYSETANFGSYVELQFGGDLLTEGEFFVSGESTVGSFQQFFARVKRGVVWRFAYDQNQVMRSPIIAPLNAGDAVVTTLGTLVTGQYYRVRHLNGQFAVFFCSGPIGGNQYAILPSSPITFPSGSEITSRDFFYQLVYIGGGLNMGWDETGLWRSYDIQARTVFD